MKRRLFIAFDVDGFRDEADIGDDVVFGVLLEERLRAWSEAQKKMPIHQSGGVDPWEFSEFNVCSSLKDLAHSEKVRPKAFYFSTQLPDGHLLHDGENVMDYGGYRYRWMTPFGDPRASFGYYRSEIINDKPST
jgi:hypothetical protein